MSMGIDIDCFSDYVVFKSVFKMNIEMVNFQVNDN